MIDELKALGEGFEASLRYATTCCEIIDTTEAVSPADAIKELIGENNKDHYMVATQDQVIIDRES